MKLLVDMNLSPRWVKRLVEAGLEASHWSSVGAANASDAEIMAFARTNGYVVLTALRQMAAQLEEGALLTVDPARARLRVLPLGSQ
jgi:predicted nuclease of predicted toxin-antitoxin system